MKQQLADQFFFGGIILIFFFFSIGDYLAFSIVSISLGVFYMMLLIYFWSDYNSRYCNLALVAKYSTWPFEQTLLLVSEIILNTNMPMHVSCI